MIYGFPYKIEWSTPVHHLELAKNDDVRWNPNEVVADYVKKIRCHKQKYKYTKYLDFRVFPLNLIKFMHLGGGELPQLPPFGFAPGFLIKSRVGLASLGPGENIFRVPSGAGL